MQQRCTEMIIMPQRCEGSDVQDEKRGEFRLESTSPHLAVATASFNRYFDWFKVECLVQKTQGGCESGSTEVERMTVQGIAKA